MSLVGEPTKEMDLEINKGDVEKTSGMGKEDLLVYYSYIGEKFLSYCANYFLQFANS